MLTRLEYLKKRGKSAQGKQELIKHLEGKRLTLSQQVKAKCYDCMNGYADGRVDCAMPDCPCHPSMPFNPKKYKKEGRKMSESQKTVLRGRMATIRSKKRA